MFGEWSAPWIVAFWGIVGITLWASAVVAVLLLLMGAERRGRPQQHINLLPVAKRFEEARLRERARMQKRAS